MNPRLRCAVFVASLCQARGRSAEPSCRPCGGAYCHYEYLVEIVDSTARSPEPVAHTGSWS